MSVTSTLTRANLRTHGRRYVSTGLAVTISTAFIVITLTVMNALLGQLTSSVYASYRGVTAVVSVADSTSPEQASSSLAQARSTLSGTAGVVATVTQTQWPADAQSSNGTRSSVYLTPFGAAPLNQPNLSEGALPTTSDEVALPSSAASVLGVGVGDTISLRQQYTDNAFVSMRISGIYQTQRAGGGIPGTYATAAGFEHVMGAAPAGPILVATNASGNSNGNPSAEDQERWVASLTSDLSGIPGITVTSAQASLDRALQQARLGGAAMTGMLLIFPAIATLVAAIVVSSTFRVVLTRRKRELALLRTLGATRAQVRRLVVTEAFAVGAISSLVGVVVGVLLSAGAIAVLGMNTFVGALGSMSVLQIVLIWLAATAFTTLVGLFPALSSSRVAPIAALTPVNESSQGARAVRTLRLVIALLISAGASAGVWWGFQNDDSQKRFFFVFVATLLLMLGLVLVFSALAPLFTRLFGVLFPGMLSHLARENTMRNPSRTSATGTAIVIGVALVVTMMVGAASLRTTLTTAVDSARPFDMAATSPTGNMSEEDATRIASTEGVAASTREYTGFATLTHTDGTPAYAPTAPSAAPNAGSVSDAGSADGAPEGDEASATDPAAGQQAEAPVGLVAVIGEPDYSTVAHSHVTQLSDNQVQVSDRALDGQALRLCSVADSTCVDVSATYSRNANEGVATVSQATLQRVVSSPSISSVVIRLSDGANPDTVQAAVLRVNSSLIVGGAAVERQMYTKMIDSILLTVVALLGVSVLVSLVGVANTLSLSVAERTRENGLLRALGLTKRQMKSLLNLEALFISLSAALVGCAMGVLFGWLGIMSLPIEGATPMLAIPWGQIVGVLAGAVVAALIASWLPGRRAARVSVTRALVTE